MQISDFNQRIEKGGIFLGGEELNIETKFYSKEIILLGNKCTLEIDPPEEEQLIDDYLKLVESDISWVNKNEGIIKSHIAKNLISLRNKTWRSNKEILDKSEFIKELKITILSVENGGEISLYFDVGKMFEGHCISLEIDKSKKMKIPKIEG